MTPNARGSVKLADAASALISSLSTRLTHEDLLAEAGHDVRIITARRNRDILVVGKHYGAVYVNHDGWLLRYKILHDGSRQIIDFILPGQIFGLQACLFRNALYSVAAITESSLSEIPFEMIDNVFERSPRLAKALFWSAVSETAIVGEHLIDAARRSAYERISHLLLELFVRLKGAGLTNDMSFVLPLTQELIGDALGLTTVHVNRTIRSLREDKLIAIDHKRVTILDFEALCMISDFENSYLGSAADAVGRKVNLPRRDAPEQPRLAPETGTQSHVRRQANLTGDAKARRVTGAPARP
ncbi:MAG TPA: Crp/Fnr family transcriptional regulator [Xanthobacteraceae bacterium]|jgi:CRP-like cAMP-binding protein